VKPIVAIVGRPNVGKSTLFNRLAGRRLAIVHDAPGVTRDRHYADADIHGREVLLLDTGGFDPESEDPLGRGIARQVELAIEEADVVVCVLDAEQPPTPADREAVELLRRAGKPVLWVANKADNPARELEANELFALGIDGLCFVSAVHGRGVAELSDAIVRALPEPAEEPAMEGDEAPRVALIGRPNAGKSSLLNRLSGAERALVDARPGTTRDPLDVRVEFAGKSYVVVDTAGIRRRPRVEEGVEAASVVRSLRALERAQIVVLLCDATEGVTDQDARLLGLCIERGRAVVIGLNKIDLMRGPDRKRAIEQAEDALRFARWAPLVALSARQGSGVAELMRNVELAAAEFQKRVPTSALNRFFEDVLERRQPPTRGGRAPRIYYVTQAEVAPPLFVAMSNAPESIAESYKRFLTNQIREAFGFSAVPLNVVFRKRERRASG
jgi:GTP-binding protein